MTESGYYEVEGKYTRAAAEWKDIKKAEKVVDTIWKYELDITDRQILLIPKNAEILNVGIQGKTLCLWALVNPDRKKQSRTIEIIGTGNPISNEGLPTRDYIGSAVIDPFVWHVFEVRG